MDLYDEKWQPVLIRNGWHDFDRIWSLELDWFEAPNYTKNGWSGVSQATLSLADGSTCQVYIKRQENCLTHTLFHPFRGVPTLRRELFNLERLHRLDIPTVQGIYYGERKLKRYYRAILITLALEGYEPLENIFQNWHTSPLSRSQRNLLLLQIAVLLRRLHQNHYAHNCLYPKHIFVDLKKLHRGAQDSIRLIDLEKAKFKLQEKRCMARDFDTLYRHSIALPRTDLMRFMQYYRSETRLSEGLKKDWAFFRNYFEQNQHKGRRTWDLHCKKA